MNTKSHFLGVMLAAAALMSAPAKAERKDYLLVGPAVGLFSPPYTFYGAGGSALFFDRLQINALVGASFFDFLTAIDANYQLPFWHLFAESNHLSVGAGWVRGTRNEENSWGDGQFGYLNLFFVVDTKWFSAFSERTQLIVGLSGVTRISRGYERDDHDWSVWPQARLHVYF